MDLSWLQCDECLVWCFDLFSKQWGIRLIGGRDPPARVAISSYRRLTSVKIPLMNISPYRTDANLSNLIDSTVVITCTQKLASTMWTRSKLRLIFTQACQMAACQHQEMQMHIFANKKTNTNTMEGGYWTLRCGVRYKWPSRRCRVMAAITSSRSRCSLPTQI